MKVPAVKQKRIAAEDVLLPSLPPDVGTRWSVCAALCVCVCFVCVCVCVCVCVFIKLRGGINDTYYGVCVCIY